MVDYLIEFMAGCVAAIAVDWLVCTRLAAYRTDSSYAYRPSPVRYTLLLAIVTFVTYLFATNDPSHPWIPGIIISAIMFIIYGILAGRDVERALAPCGNREDYY